MRQANILDRNWKMKRLFRFFNHSNMLFLQVGFYDGFSRTMTMLFENEQKR